MRIHVTWSIANPISIQKRCGHEACGRSAKSRCGQFYDVRRMKCFLKDQLAVPSPVFLCLNLKGFIQKETNHQTFKLNTTNRLLDSQAKMAKYSCQPSIHKFHQFAILVNSGCLDTTIMMIKASFPSFARAKSFDLMPPKMQQTTAKCRKCIETYRTECLPGFVSGKHCLYNVRLSQNTWSQPAGSLRSAFHS